MEVHPVAALFPMLPDDELQELAEDIKARGLIQPIVLDAQSRILDGRNRQRACELVAVEPIYEKYDGADSDGYALAVNINRRHLTKGQRAMIMAQTKIKSKFNLPTIDEGDITKQYLRMAMAVVREAPDFVDLVVVGSMGLPEAYKQTLQRREDAKTHQERMTFLRDKAPDLADRVEAEDLDLRDAMAAASERDRLLREHEQRVVDSLAQNVNWFVNYSTPEARHQVLAAMRRANGRERITLDEMYGARQSLDALISELEAS